MVRSHSSSHLCPESKDITYNLSRDTEARLRLARETIDSVATEIARGCKAHLTIQLKVCSWPHRAAATSFPKSPAQKFVADCPASCSHILTAVWEHTLFYPGILVVKLSMYSSELTGNQKLFVSENFVSSLQGTLLTEDYSQTMYGIKVLFSSLVHSTLLVNNITLARHS